MSNAPVKFGTFKDLLLDRQIEELVAYARRTADKIPAAAICAPTTITAFSTAGGFGHVRLGYSYTAYTGHKYTEVWRSADTDFANAERVGATAARFYQDFPSAPAISTVYYYWGRNVNLNGDEGDLYGPIAGSVGSDPNYNLETLLGQLGFGHFQNGTYPIRTEPSFPTLPSTTYPVGTLIYLTTNQLLYKQVNEVWEPVMAAADMVGEITETQIADDSISTPHLKALCVTANEMAANSVIFGKIAAGALAVDDGVMQNGYIKNAHITDCSVSKLIAGIISAGDIYLGADSLIHLDGANQKIVVSDGTYDRVIIGNLGGDWGIEVRDASNNVILTNDGVNWSGVVGAGKPADNADVTASNPQGASWLTDAVVYSGNKIAEANIGTYMSTAAILEAYIKDAQVSTLKLQDQAVTFAVSSFLETEGTITNTSTSTYKTETVRQVSITSTGAPIDIHWALTACGYREVSYGDNIEGTFKIQLYQGTTKIFDSGWLICLNNGTTYKGHFSGKFRHTPSSGSYVYYLKMLVNKASQNGYDSVMKHSNKYIKVEETKK
jgi:hypothetical protein